MPPQPQYINKSSTSKFINNNNFGKEPLNKKSQSSSKSSQFNHLERGGLRNPVRNSAFDNQQMMGGMGNIAMMGNAFAFSGSPYSGGMYGNPMSFIYSMNYFISMVSQVAYVLSMNSHMFMDSCRTVSAMVSGLEKLVRQSELRRWLQRKSKKSAVLRYVFVLSSMAIAAQLYRLARNLVMNYLQRRTPHLVGAESSGGALSALL